MRIQNGGSRGESLSSYYWILGAVLACGLLLLAMVSRQRIIGKHAGWLVG